jgi:hypothetical protein
MVVASSGRYFPAYDSPEMTKSLEAYSGYSVKMKDVRKLSIS